MDDLISRQDAIEAIEEYADRLQMVDWKENPGVPYKAYALNWCINTIRELPSAQLERKKGHWIQHDEIKNVYGGICIECSECGEKYVVQHILDEKYCRNCGADMRGEQHG